MSRNADLLARRTKAVPRGVAHATAIYADRADNSLLWDVDGRRYIDFAGGIAVLNTGHRHPRVMAAAAAQMERFTHSAFQVAAYEPYVALAERLNALAPFSGPAKTVFFTTGAEAVENAVKIARVATGRSGVIAFTGAFHGRTLMTSALTGKVNPYKKDAGPMPPEVWHLPFPIPHHGITVADTLKALDFLFRADVEPERVAAFILEPVQGEGGFNPAPPELLRDLRRLCDAHGILLIADEVQAGFGRTGRMFGIEHAGVEPDLVTIAKSLAGGFPLSGVIGRAAIMDKVAPGGLGGTYGGNPMACAAALAVLDVIEEEGLLARADAIGGRIKARLESVRERNDILPIGAIRGPGAMVAFEIFKERGGVDPDADATRQVTARALDLGLVLLSCGVHGNVIRILAPLTIPDAELDAGLDILARALAVTP
ncbi:MULTISPECIES: 4-aminobutyrate--2-oxoglutarate transaminase [Nitrospirillum]|uniref:4-aminobutyrate aminotransferase/(S)-3-amino-2-methylpropionate transaminase n=1 Tax=Nitrospirillum amazonense TaxID=28077 RepID=A0A560FVK0_9PROT|nr:4-aminobutyrate--2-oxoglutarate transaminase [Nitrospirillum amazonense]MEC4594922.1 4-aminobutyrate--2-oxoglutarate transaminase [Nitrospirillum amazonense]TWB25612.1 4-aminobutyrate aminotransferase/(S)-3-amino-2-methylpropionate transaminase [Nitrospirillum amazonense]